MLSGKPAGVKCIQLDDNYRCKLFGKPERPPVCGSLRPSAEMCGNSNEHARGYLDMLEQLTK
jgi:hypothetical protein